METKYGGLTPGDLRQRYQEDLLTETEIAHQAGISQVQVGRLRKKWGIPTITPGERQGKKLPPLTTTQEQIVLGSLLGDGWMRATSNVSASFGDGHCEAQAAYTDWKAEILRPFVSNVRDGGKSDHGNFYKSRALMTFACPQLRPFYDLFYPPPKRIRVFPADLHKRITPLALAVWYMDDGSLASEGRNARFSFGLGDTSLRRCLRALRALGLKPKHYGEGGDVEILIMGQTHKFLALVQEHIPECMAYKIPVETPRQKVDRNARKLTPEAAGELYLGGLSPQAIGEVYGVGASTVSRRLKMGGVKKRKSGPQSKISRDAAAGLLVARYPDTAEWSTLPEKTQQEWIEDIYQVLRRVPFPVPSHVEDPKAELGKVERVDLVVGEPGVIPSRSYAGLQLCYPFFPGRYKVKNSGAQVSAWEGWHMEQHLKRAIKFQLQVGDPVIPYRVLRALTANCRTPTIFRPVVARFIYEQFCPPGGTTWDPCSGYGGRLVGAAAAGVKYLATEVSPETVRGNRALSDALGAKAEIYQIPAQEFEPPPVDLVFTSPPYFTKEKYAGGEQSWESFQTFEDWVKGFLRPVVGKGAEALNPGGYWTLNVADIRVGNKVYPLVETAREVLRETGLAEQPEWRMPLMALNRKNPWEPVLVFQKK